MEATSLFFQESNNSFNKTEDNKSIKSCPEAYNNKSNSNLEYLLKSESKSSSYLCTSFKYFKRRYDNHIRDYNLKNFKAKKNKATTMECDFEFNKRTKNKLIESKSCPLIKCSKVNIPENCYSCGEIQLCNEWKKYCKTLNKKKIYKLTEERLYELKNIVNSAISSSTTFTIRGIFPTLRSELLKRNWIEKFENTKPKSYNLTNISDLSSNLPFKQSDESIKSHENRCEKIIMSRLLHNHDVNLYWNQTRDHSDWAHRSNMLKLLNRFKSTLFTSKEGLALLLQETYWFYEPEISNIYFPRCYVLGFPDHFEDFIEDFRMTACISLLKWFVFYWDDINCSFLSKEGTVDLNCINFAIDQCARYISFKKHTDLDQDLFKITNYEWKQFLNNFYMVVHQKQKIKVNEHSNIRSLCASAKLILREMIKYWPQYNIDGNHNVWLIKPANESQGKGIQLIHTVEEVARIIHMKLKYVVQKYIERPFLIYKTKFDIRQLFIITCVEPLTIWMYKDSYLRFSSHMYNLNDFHEQIHLTNHAVQCKYSNVSDRDPNLPEENMWHSSKFKEYLNQIGYGEKWENVIYPGMRECIIGTMLACQETMDRRPNTFGIFGADFMIAEDFKPWLIEINYCPNLLPSTSVTALLCARFIADVIKVVIDRRSDPSGKTGQLEMVYKQYILKPIIPINLNLFVKGHRIFRTKKIKEKRRNKTEDIKSFSDLESQSSLYNGPVIHDLIEELKHTKRTPF